MRKREKERERVRESEREVQAGADGNTLASLGEEPEASKPLGRL